MTDFPWLTVLILVPLVGAVVTAFAPRNSAKAIGLGASVLTLVLAVVAATQFKTGGEGLQLVEDVDWIAPLGIHYALGLDGLGLLMVLLTVVLIPLVLLAAWPDAEEDGSAGPRSFVAWTLALEAMSLAVFTATDVFLFYVVFEATLIPAYFLIAGFGREGRSRAAVKFLIYQLAGGLIMLLSVIGLYVQASKTGSASYLLTDLSQLTLDPTVEKWLFAGFFIAFAIKAPMFPVHTWLADTTQKASTGVSVLLVCILDKIGTFGMLRFCLGLFPEASKWATPVVVVLALISIIYGALVAIGQDDVLRLIGLTSLSHFGFIVLGIFVFNANGGAGAILYMVNHGIATAADVPAGRLLDPAYGHRVDQADGRPGEVGPVLAGFLLVAGLAAAVACRASRPSCPS
jgi:NADH-quinone oxidoreductase subunit M